MINIDRINLVTADIERIANKAYDALDVSEKFSYIPFIKPFEDIITQANGCLGDIKFLVDTAEIVHAGHHKGVSNHIFKKALNCIIKLANEINPLKIHFEAFLTNSDRFSVVKLFPDYRTETFHTDNPYRAYNDAQNAFLKRRCKNINLYVLDGNEIKELVVSCLCSQAVLERMLRVDPSSVRNVALTFADWKLLKRAYLAMHARRGKRLPDRTVAKEGCYETPAFSQIA